MAQNIPATILGVLAGAAVSVASGALIGSYVVGGVAPAYAAPPRIRPEPALVDQQSWPASDPMAAVSGQGGFDQADGVLASGSSRL